LIVSRQTNPAKLQMQAVRKWYLIFEVLVFVESHAERMSDIFLCKATCCAQSPGAFGEFPVECPFCLGEPKPRRLDRCRYQQQRRGAPQITLSTATLARSVLRLAVWDDEAVFGGSAGTRGGGGAGWRHDSGNCGAVRREYQFRGTFP
jgi:hypothetical protein